jgi:hypothetical protein
MSILADTNILLRRSQPHHPNHTLAVESVEKLLANLAHALVRAVFTLV